MYKKMLFFDSPMSGGEIGAKEGKLSLMVEDKKKFNDLKKITNTTQNLVFIWDQVEVVS